MRSTDPGIIIEFARVGAYLKVSAFHEPTMTEVSIVGDPNETERHLRQTVLKKLSYVLNKKKKTEADQSKSTPSGKRGIIV